VLISKDLVEILGLVPKPLFKLLSISGTFTKEKRNLDFMLLLSEYCRLYVQSPNTVWKLKAINAIICPELHMDLILSLDFLSKNKIVVDTNLQTVIDKTMGYDLLNPPDPTLNRKLPTLSPYQCREQHRQQIKNGKEKCRKLSSLVLLEMKNLFKDNLKHFDMERYTTGPAGVIAVVQT
jgi:hypothetical protein